MVLNRIPTALWSVKIIANNSSLIHTFTSREEARNYYKECLACGIQSALISMRIHDVDSTGIPYSPRGRRVPTS